MLLKGLFLHLLSFLTFSKTGFMFGPHSLNMSLTRTTAASEIIVTTLKRISEKIRKSWSGLVRMALGKRFAFCPDW